MSTSTGFQLIPSTLVAPLDLFNSNELPLAGGKGANLGELLKAGFNVPPGFVITTAAYDLFLKEEGLQAGLQDQLALLNSNQPDSPAQASREIRQLFERAPIPKILVKPILDARGLLGDVPVAVRSSATAEDLPGAAFAGQQDTFLNIQGEAALLKAVKDCWASLWSERAILYRSRQNIEPGTVKLAVVVQQMVPADAAGVMFTANPVTGERDELIIDASPGLGEAVVAGLVSPDHFALKKPQARIVKQQIGRREVIIRPKAGGGTEWVESRVEGEPVPCLSSSAVRQLARLGLAIEKHYGAPQDIEWAWVQAGVNKGTFLILQARPMTALPEPLETKVSGPMRMVLPMLAEMWPVRPYPLDMTTFTGVLERAVGNFLVFMLGKSAPDPDAALLEDDGVVVRFQPPVVHPSPAMLISAGLTFWRTRHYDPSKWEQDPLLAEVIEKGHDLNAREAGSLTWEQNMMMIHEALALIPDSMRLRERYLPRAILGLGELWLLVKLAGRGDRLALLLGGIETKTTETNLALQSLADKIRKEPFLLDLFSRCEAAELQTALQGTDKGQAFLKSLADFLREYGHRETALTISQGAWVDQPQVVLGILKVEAATSPRAPDSYQEWKNAREDLLSHSILGSWPFPRAFLKALTNARALFQIREDTHFYATLAQPPVRHAALELGRRLKEAGVFENEQEVLHLRLEELEELGQPWPPSDATASRLRGLVAQRQAKREALSAVPMVDPRLLAVESLARPGEQVLLSGSAGSPGVASGPARIVCDGTEFGKLKPGDVLVAPVTNPAWTPLFQHAVAVVVDTGGTASHAAIVAREYGVPAVMGTLHGTQQLTDGQWIVVDGSRGLVLQGERPK